MANYPLAALMSVFSNVANNYGKQYAQKQSLKDRLEMMQEMEVESQPGVEAAKKRQMLLSMGIDPDTGQPIPEYWKAKEQAAALAAKFKKGKASEDTTKNKGKSAAERQAEADAADTGRPKPEVGGNWFTSLFK